VAAFFGWGIGLSFLQWGAERSAVLLWLTARLAEALAFGLGSLVDLPLKVDGSVVTLYGWSQEVTPNCFGLAAVTFYVAAVLATPAPWRARARGIGLGLLAILLANAARLFVLSVFFAYAWFAFGFVHIPIWGTVVPLFLVSVWGLWVVRDLHVLSRFPGKLLGRVALLAAPLLAVWYVVLDEYVVMLVLGINAVLTTLGVPIETLRLASAELFRYVDVGVPGGGFRIEVAAQTLNVVPCLALILASPLALRRRALLGVYALATLVALHAVGTAAVMVLGWSARPLVGPFQVVNDFVSLAAGPSLWLLLARPFAPPLTDAPHPAPATAQARRARPAARRVQ
jgi:exosortase/archaeosortase family protein